MNCTVIYGGFNPAWRAGQLERELVDSLVKNLNDQYPDVSKAVVVTSWHEPTDLISQLQKLQPELTVLCSLTDPLGPIENLIDQIPGQVRLVGYVDSEFFYDFLLAIQSLPDFQITYPNQSRFYFLSANQLPQYLPTTFPN